MDYIAVKHAHMALALLSISGFIWRATLKFYSPQNLNKRWLKIAPHAIDTLLLACAIYLCIRSGQYPLSANWLTAKVVALLLYIGFGLLLMRFARSRQLQALALLGALASFGYMAAVAMTKSPYPWQ